MKITLPACGIEIELLTPSLFQTFAACGIVATGVTYEERLISVAQQIQSRYSPEFISALTFEHFQRATEPPIFFGDPDECPDDQVPWRELPPLDQEFLARKVSEMIRPQPLTTPLELIGGTNRSN